MTVHARTSTLRQFPRVRVRSATMMILDIWTATLIAAGGPDILRMKAVILADGFDTPFVIHGVQRIIDPPIRLARWAGVDRQSRIRHHRPGSAERALAGQPGSAEDMANGAFASSAR